MAFRIRWEKLDDTAAECLRAVINSKLRAMAAQVSVLQSVELTHLSFGNNEPYLELTDIGPSMLADGGDGLCVEALRDVTSNGGRVAYQARNGGCQPPEACTPPNETLSDVVSLDASTTEASTTQPPTKRIPPVHSDSSESPIAQLFGADGIALRFRLLYGGGIELAGRLGIAGNIMRLNDSSSLEASMPVRFTVSQAAIDTMITLDIHDGIARIWLEPSSGESDAPFSQLDIAVLLGDGDDDVDTSHLGALLSRELQTLLSTAMCFPNAVEISLS